MTTPTESGTLARVSARTHVVERFVRMSSATSYGLCLFLIVACLSLKDGLAAKFNRVCYVCGWSRFRQAPATFHPEDIDPELCTHLVFAFVSLDSSATKIVPKEGDDLKIYKRYTDLKRKSRDLKVLVSLGGVQAGSRDFRRLVRSERDMRTFTNNVVRFLRRHDFDGIDLDWEYPGDSFNPEVDRRQFAVLARMLRMKFSQEAAESRRPRLLLSAALGPSPYRARRSYDIYLLARSLDLFNLMTYDMHGWERPLYTGHHSALFGSEEDPHTNIDYVVKYWASAGAPKRKIHVGVPFYGKTFTLANPSENGVGVLASGPGRPGAKTKTAGILAYNEFCQKIPRQPRKATRQGLRRVHLSEQRVPYLLDGDRWIGYDDQQSLKEKAQYVAFFGYGGVMVWALDFDDFRGRCGPRYPLMTVIKETLEHPAFA